MLSSLSGSLILKKPSDSNKAVHEESRYRVIDIQNEAPDFIKTDYELYGEHDLVLSGTNPGTTLITFEDAEWEASEFYDALLVGSNVGKTKTGFIKVDFINNFYFYIIIIGLLFYNNMYLSACNILIL